ncbi:MAG: DNA primase [Actinomycetota bacterium]
MYRRVDIDRVRAATNLVDLVGAVTTVKRQGRAFVAVCPFHQEKTPSLSLDPARGLYHCFGCGKGGDVFTFIEETQGLDFNESVELLAGSAGIQLETDPGVVKRRGEHDELVDAVRKAVEVYQTMLRSAPDAGPARAYLRGRGIGAETVDDYLIGYAPERESWDALITALREKGVKDRTMLNAGLARRGRGGKLYDLFRRRVVFPIFDLRGDPVGFGGRGIEGASPKYLNSPESRLYQKSRLLYGLNRAKGAIARSQEAVVVEGYFDVIACHRAGVETAVATCGTALGEDHFDLLRRFTDRVVLAFDSDQAGAGAALRGDQLKAPVDLDFDLRVAEMPDGMDPADLVQAERGADLAKAVKASRPLLQFRLEKEIGKHNLTEPEGRARAIKNTVRLLGRVTDPVARGEYVRFAARLIGVDVPTIELAFGGERRGGPKAVGAAVEQHDPVQHEMLRLVLDNPVELQNISIDRSWFDGDLLEAYDEVVARRNTTPGGTPLDLNGLEHFELLSRVALDPRPLSKDPGEVVRRARSRALEPQIKRLEQELAELDPSGEVYSETLRRLIALQREQKVEGQT